MNKRCAWLAGVLLTLSAASVWAADAPQDHIAPAEADQVIVPWLARGWHVWGFSGSGKSLVRYLYTGRKVRRDAIRSIWILALGISKDIDTDAKTHWPYRAVKSLWWVNCHDGSSDMRASYYYSDAAAKNTVLGLQTEKASSEPATFTREHPGSVGEGIVRTACRSKK